MESVFIHINREIFPHTMNTFLINPSSCYQHTIQRSPPPWNNQSSHSFGDLFPTCHLIIAAPKKLSWNNQSSHSFEDHFPTCLLTIAAIMKPLLQIPSDLPSKNGP